MINTTMVDIMLHIDETLSHKELEKVRDSILGMTGVMAASFHDEKPHLMIIEYDPEQTTSMKLLEKAKSKGIHAELVGL